MKERENLSVDQGLLAQYEIFVVRPGGNDTAFVKGIYNPQQRKKINDAIMRVYPNIEQVGFISVEGNTLELMMTGGEFCGNATRAFAWLVLKGKTGELQIKTSGVYKPLKAGVDQNGNAWVEIPVDLGVKPITRIDETTNLVELDGISHLIVKVTTPLSTIMKLEDIKSFAVCMLDRLKLRERVPAAGVMFISEYDDGLYLEPVVWVSSIQTLFFETACGSGTAAAGLVLANETGTLENAVKVTQPSGLPIWVSIGQDSDSEFARISGPVESIT